MAAREVGWLAGAAFALLLAGCAPPALLGGAAIAMQAPQWISIAQEVVTGVKVLTEVQQLACNLQTAANARGDAMTSYYAGFGCAW